MKELLIQRCRDSSMWYRDLIGKRVPLIREIEEGWLSREPSGFTNIIKRGDARVVEVDSGPSDNTD